MTDAPLRLKSFEVSSLFGLLDHKISFKTDDRITILHGPNGVGKTTVLRLIAGLFEPGARIWREAAFKRIVVKFLPHGTLTITPADGPREGIHYRYTKGKEKEETTIYMGSGPRSFPLSAVDDFIPWLERAGPERWFDRRRGVVLDLDDVLVHYSEHFPPHVRLRLSDDEIAPWLASLTSSVSTQFIQTHRLRARASEKRRGPRHRGKADPHGHAVEALADNLSVRIRESLRESGSLAASLDRTFPKRLLEGKLPRQATEAEIRKRYREQEELRARLMAAGLLDAEEEVPLPVATLEAGERKVLWYYLQDVDKKLRVHTSLLERVELLKDIIDEKDFLFKSIEISQRHGFRFRSDHGDIVPLGSLSSGEQHELVLTYELLFGSRGKQLILIDEPELSLHVMWQRTFLADMQRIANLADLDFVLATHSPAIVSDRTDLMVELTGRRGA